MAANENVVMEGVKIIFRNFAGVEGMYNRKGDRNFSVLLEDDVARDMEQDGWNVKWLKPREEGDKPQASLPVAVSFPREGTRIRPPRIVLITSRGRTNLTEEEVELLDWVDIRNVDVIVRPYHWNVSGNTGVKAYMQSIYITIQEDALELKYAEVPEIVQLESGVKNSIEATDTLKALNRGSEEYDEAYDIVDAELVED